MKKLTALTMSAVILMSQVGFADYASVKANALETTAEVTVENLSGGWQASGSLSKKDAESVLKKADSEKKYEAIGLLGTQVVAGFNRAILCKADENSCSSYKIIYVYENLSGGAEILGEKVLSKADYTVSESYKMGSAAKADVKKAAKNLTDGTFKPIALIGSRSDKIKEYSLVFCKVTAKNGKVSYALISYSKSKSGKIADVNTEKVVIGDYEYIDSSEEIVGFVNPWQDYTSLSKANKAAGIDFKLPKKLNEKSIKSIRAMSGMIDVTYGGSIVIRKGKGTEDISGDYNEYKTKTVKYKGIEITLRLNGSKVYGAIWSDGQYSYAYYADKGVTESKAKSNIISVIKKN